MATYPIKVLLDRNRQPFIPFTTTSSIVENGTNRRLDKILGNLDDLQTNNKNSLVSAINEILVGSGSGAGINIQIVDELPTENISLTTIYFKHMTTGKLHNVYEEWMYINDAWELIGTTEMDLSGYATTAMVGDLSTLKTTDKDSVVDAVNELVDKQLVAGDGIELNGNVIKSVSDVPIYRIKVSEYIYDDAFVSIDQQDILKIEDKINKAYKSGLNTIGFIVSSIHNDEQYLLINNSSDIQSKPSSYWLYSIESIHNRYFNFGRTEAYTLLTIQLMISLSWTEDTCKVTSANICRAPLPLLATNNTVQYIPTSDYHPATKKYVDDKVAEGSGSGVDLSNYLAKDNTTEFTPTADYNPSTKKYVDDKFSSVPTIDSYTKTEVDTKLANYLAKDNLTEYTPTSDYHPATKKFVETVVASIDMSGYYNKTEIDELIGNVTKSNITFWTVAWKSSPYNILPSSGGNTNLVGYVSDTDPVTYSHVSTNKYTATPDSENYIAAFKFTEPATLKNVVTAKTKTKLSKAYVRHYLKYPSSPSSYTVVQPTYVDVDYSASDSDGFFDTIVTCYYDIKDTTLNKLLELERYVYIGTGVSGGPDIVCKKIESRWEIM